jgi:DNA-binding transcriptional regulator LsrR (DeoR family)
VGANLAHGIGHGPIGALVSAWHEAGRSQRAIARELNIDRRKVKRIIDQAA